MRRTKNIIIIVALLVWSKAYVVVDINGQEYVHKCTTNDWTQEQLHNNYIEK